MADRRRSIRYSFSAPPDALARTVHDAVIEKWDDENIVVTTTPVIPKGDGFVMRFISPSGEVATCAVRVVSSSLVAGENALQSRFIVTVSPEAPDWRFDPIPPF